MRKTYIILLYKAKVINFLLFSDIDDDDWRWYDIVTSPQLYFIKGFLLVLMMEILKKRMSNDFDIYGELLSVER